MIEVQPNGRFQATCDQCATASAPLQTATKAAARAASMTRPLHTSNRFGVGAGLGLVWLTAPPEPGEPLERSEVLNLAAAIAVVAGFTLEELAAAVAAVREGPTSA